MSLPLPRYALARIADDGSCGEIEIYPLSEPPWEVDLDRRRFLRAGLSAAAILAALGGGCSDATRTAAEAPQGCDDAKAHTGGVRALAVSREGFTLASAGADGDIKLWSLPAGGYRQTLAGAYSEGLALGMDGETLFALRPIFLARWRLSATEAQPLDDRYAGGGGTFLAMSPEGGFLALLTPAGAVELLGQSGRAPGRVLDGAPAASTLVFSADGRKLAVDGGGTSILFLDLAQGGRRTLIKSRGSEKALALDAGGRWLAAASHGGLLEIWPLDATVPKPRSLEDQDRVVIVAAFSPDGTLLATGDETGQVVLLRIPEGEVTQTLKKGDSSVTALAFSPDGSLLIVGDEAGAIRLWELASGELRSCLIDLAVSPPSAQGVSYEVRSAGGQTVTYTVACGSPVPPGATCTCNCVPGALSPPTPPSYDGGGGGGTYCSCDQVCVCIPVG